MHIYHPMVTIKELQNFDIQSTFYFKLVFSITSLSARCCGRYISPGNSFQWHSNFVMGSIVNTSTCWSLMGGTDLYLTRKIFCWSFNRHVWRFRQYFWASLSAHQPVQLTFFAVIFCFVEPRFLLVLLKTNNVFRRLFIRIFNIITVHDNQMRYKIICNDSIFQVLGVNTSS